MPLSKFDAALVWDMLEHARVLAEVAKKHTAEDLKNDRMLQLAVERAMEIIGEAARKVSDEAEAAHPEIPWQAIVAQRHVLAHDYGELDYERLWRVVSEKVPELILQLDEMMPEPPPDPEPEETN